MATTEDSRKSVALTAVTLAVCAESLGAGTASVSASDSCAGVMASAAPRRATAGTVTLEAPGEL